MDSAEVWPENWRSWLLFCEMSGQWRVTPAGERMGLDYTALFARMDRMGLDGEAWEELFADIRAIESAALDQIAANE